MKKLSLSELTTSIKKTLEEKLKSSYWVTAEIAQIQVNQSGHCYLELVQKEEGKIIATVKATIWANAYNNITMWFERIAGSNLKPGMLILAHAKVSFHEVYGLSLNLKDIDPTFTVGERERERQKVIQRLKSDGIMDLNNSLDMPTICQNIAVISSKTTAGYGDFIDQVNNNLYSYKVNYHLFPSIMQGDKAPKSMINVLNQINKIEDFDAVVIIRGGGSQLDLDCFDDYELCSHIAQFPIPILTGIGHKRDTSIADIVAHTQLKTPTAVAEFIIQSFRTYILNLENLCSTIAVFSTTYINNEEKKLAYISTKIAQYTIQNLHRNRIELNTIIQTIKHKIFKKLTINSTNLESIEQKINLLNPKHLLKKGYSLTYINGNPIGETKITKGDKIETITISQKINSTVDKTIKID